ncbi:MAG: hypothetical protein AB7S71_18225 [Dongiaceae bacterium]
MSSAVETRRHLAEFSYFGANAESWPLDIATHRYVEARSYPTKDAALTAMLTPGFFDPCRRQRGAIRENDRIDVQIGEQSADAWFLTVAVVSVGAAKSDDPIVVKQIGPVTKSK